MFYYVPVSGIETIIILQGRGGPIAARILKTNMYRHIIIMNFNIVLVYNQNKK